MALAADSETKSNLQVAANKNDANDDAAQSDSPMFKICCRMQVRDQKPDIFSSHCIYTLCVQSVQTLIKEIESVTSSIVRITAEKHKTDGHLIIKRISNKLSELDSLVEILSQASTVIDDTEETAAELLWTLQGRPGADMEQDIEWWCCEEYNIHSNDAQSDFTNTKLERTRQWRLETLIIKVTCKLEMLII